MTSLRIRMRVPASTGAKGWRGEGVGKLGEGRGEHRACGGCAGTKTTERVEVGQVTARMNLANIVLSEVSQLQKDNIVLSHSCKAPRVVQFTEESRKVVAGAEGRGRELVFKGHGISVWEGEEFWMVVAAAQ